MQSSLPLTNSVKLLMKHPCQSFCHSPLCTIHTTNEQGSSILRFSPVSASCFSLKSGSDMALGDEISSQGYDGCLQTWLCWTAFNTLSRLLVSVVPQLCSAHRYCLLEVNYVRLLSNSSTENMLTSYCNVTNHRRQVILISIMICKYTDWYICALVTWDTQKSTRALEREGH